jgi:hypothetical protein
LAPVDDEPEAPPVEDEPLGIDDEDDPLGDVALEEAPLGEDEDDEDEPLGEAAGLLEDDAASALAWTPSFAAVSVSRRPVAFRPSFCW